MINPAAHKRIRVITGHYGSGKTEFAINYAMLLNQTKKHVHIADLDVINTYFRSRELTKELKELGINVIGASVEASAVDVPAISAEVMGPIIDKEADLILDVGGNPAGARALGHFRKAILREEYDHFFVLNRNRPETTTEETALAFLRQTEAIAGMSVTGLINSTHMLKSTTIEDVLYGQELCNALSASTGIPVVGISLWEKIADDLPEEYRDIALPMQLTLRRSWMS
ncbi:MAG: ATP-binding protein [Tissierellia bacterium]|jgi:hypothetical protein|nr:ATP-binding protein [Bacillota bacterium]NLK58461.1 ATP-binding protein [Tissierellia bacterium]